MSDEKRMTREEAIELLESEKNRFSYKFQPYDVETREKWQCAYDMAIKALEQALSNDGTLTVNVEDGNKVSRVLVCGENHFGGLYYPEQEQKTGHCKDCKYFEYDSVAKVDGIPLIVAHEICNKWGDGCKTKEDGYCFLFEPQESEE